jgi:hypothetical protein
MTVASEWWDDDLPPEVSSETDGWDWLEGVNSDEALRAWMTKNHPSCGGHVVVTGEGAVRHCVLCCYPGLGRPGAQPIPRPEPMSNALNRHFAALTDGTFRLSAGEATAAVAVGVAGEEGTPAAGIDYSRGPVATLWLMHDGSTSSLGGWMATDLYERVYQQHAQGIAAYCGESATENRSSDAPASEPRPAKPVRRQPNLPDATLTRALELRGQGLTLVEVARELGYRSASSVHHLIKTAQHGPGTTRREGNHS